MRGDPVRCVSPYPDELLTSVLARTAQVQGLGAGHVLFRLLGHQQVWNRDVDRTASAAFIARLAHAFGIEPTILEQGLLLDAASRARPLAGLSLTPGITPVGVYHRVRHRFGLQYCPLCLDETPAFVRSWRYAFLTVCPRHRIRLRDACASCKRPIMPHRQRYAPERCACGGALSVRLPSDVPAEPLLASRMLLRARAEGSVPVAGQHVTWPDLIAGCSTLLAWLGVVARRTRLERRRVERWEFGRVAERHERLTKLSAVLAEWPQRFVATAATHALTQRSIVGMQPTWLASAVRQLPRGVIHDRGAAARRLRGQLRQVHRCKGPGWRTARAGLIAEAALA